MPPNRISIDHDDIAYDPIRASFVDHVTINGRRLENVVTADEDTGEAVVLVFNDDNELLVHPDDPCLARVKFHYGKVDIYWKPGYTDYLRIMEIWM